MERFTFRDGVMTYTRISKREARKLWDKNEFFHICPSKLRPGGPWSPDTRVFPDHYKSAVLPFDFDSMVRNFNYYNASYETGYYPSFWIVNEK